MSKTFSPKSRQEDERQIQRRQSTFEGGMFADVVPSQIPDNGVYYSKNFRNLGFALEGRTGSKEWGDRTNTTSCAPLPYYKTDIVISTTGSGGGYKTLTSATAFDTSDIGNMVVLENGDELYIENLINGGLTIYSTTTDVTLPSTPFTISLKKHKTKLNGFYFHKLLKKIIMFYDNDLYVARDLYISAWDKAVCESVDAPASEKVTFDEINNAVVMFNSNGIYKMDLTDYPTVNPVYYKINAKVPQAPLDDQDEIITPVVTRRYLYTMSKFKRKTYSTPPTGAELLYENNYLSRFDTTNELLLDSGSNLVNNELRDYATYDLGGTNKISGFSIPNNETQWDSYSIWATADISPSGLDPVSGVGNNSEAYILLGDMPICQAFKVEFSLGSVVAFNGDSYGPPTYNFKNIQSGSTVKLYSTYSGITGAAVIQTGDVLIGISHFTINGSTSDQYLNAAPFTTVMFYGAEKGALLNVSGGIVNVVSGSTITSGDIGKRIFMQDGRQFHITNISGTSGIIAENDTITNALAGCWGQEGGFKKIWDGSSWVDGSRFFIDTVDEDVLKARITGYPLYQRFFQELPSSTVGTTIPGWMLVGSNNLLSYSQMPDGYEYLTGYYHPLYQIAQTKDNIRAFGQFIDRLVIYCANSTYFIPTNIIESVDLTELGISISVLSTLNIADTNIGIINSKTLCDVEQNKQILITNEPAVRIFDGTKFSDSLSSKRVSNILNKLGTSFSTVYLPYMGYIFWGNE
jgi:hypothetical protein